MPPYAMFCTMQLAGEFVTPTVEGQVKITLKTIDTRDDRVLATVIIEPPHGPPTSVTADEGQKRCGGCGERME